VRSAEPEAWHPGLAPRVSKRPRDFPKQVGEREPGLSLSSGAPEARDDIVPNQLERVVGSSAG